MNGLTSKLPGVGAAILVAVVSLLLSSLHYSFDPLLISLIFGILIANMVGEKDLLAPGVDFSVKAFLPLGIGLYGSQLSMRGASFNLWPAVLIAVILFFLITYIISKSFGLRDDVPLLLSAGISISGASAIAVVSSLLGSKKEDTSISIISVMVLGLTGMLFLSFQMEGLGLSARKFAFLVGTVLPSIGFAKVATAPFGEQTQHLATGLSLLRLAALWVLAVGLLILRGGRKGAGVSWFMIVFFGLAVFVNIFDTTSSFISKALASPSVFFLSAGLAGVGFSVNFDSITDKGARPLSSVFLSWIIVVLFIYLVLYAF